jgi:hypothetical protein
MVRMIRGRAGSGALVVIEASVRHQKKVGSDVAQAVPLGKGLCQNRLSNMTGDEGKLMRGRKWWSI